MMKKSIAERIFEGANTLFMLLMIIVTLYPIVYVPLSIHIRFKPAAGPPRDCCFTPWGSIWMPTKKYCTIPW